ncbi:PREDICTED: uncharacterized protein LOC108378352 [Rhagoletis zephyria]|uniref:uncharacterized protein LOC108378352 n=1 Tax=Rhagoletis zephyria TaxID=28612 RepID=UPI00081197D7|nr:PREDICTED: uncharacterized protein LOC108378352 [Rhagoletis zephyria]
MQQSDFNYISENSDIQHETSSSQTLYLIQPSPSTTTSLDSATSSAIQSFINDACQKAIEKVEERNKLILLRVTEEIQGLRKDVGELRKAVSHNNSTILPTRLFSTVEDFLQFEKAVQEDMDKFSLLKADLKRLSTSSSRKFVTKSGQKLMHNKVAESFSWKGTVDNKCIRAFSVATAIRQTFTCENGGKEEDFVFASKSFFQYAKNLIKIKAPKENTK